MVKYIWSPEKFSRFFTQNCVNQYEISLCCYTCSTNKPICEWTDLAEISLCYTCCMNKSICEISAKSVHASLSKKSPNFVYGELKKFGDFLLRTAWTGLAEIRLCYTCCTNKPTCEISAESVSNQIYYSGGESGRRPKFLRKMLFRSKIFRYSSQNPLSRHRIPWFSHDRLMQFKSPELPLIRTNPVYSGEGRGSEKWAHFDLLYLVHGHHTTHTTLFGTFRLVVLNGFSTRFQFRPVFF